jgi:hypothetical protein
MNPLAYTKCARRLLMALAAISGIFLATGCGSSSSSSTNPVGFSNSSLNGTYVFSSTGTDSQGSFLALAGAITADGNGNITAGNVDVVDFNAGFASGSATGTYGVGTDGRGEFTISVTGAQKFAFDLVLSSTSHGLVSEFDSFGTGSGTIDLQTALTGISQLANPYAMSLSGADISDSFPIASAGSITFNASGVMTAAVQDFNENGIPDPNTTPNSGSVTLGTGLAPGSIVFNNALGSGSTFDFYPVDATHFKVIETDLNNALLAGDFYSQANATIPSGPVVFTMAGGTNNIGPTVVGGYATTDSHGNFTAGSEDINKSGTFVQSISFTGAAGAAGVGGRVVVTLTNSPADTWVIYPTTSFGLVILQGDAINLTLGAAYPQSATSFAASQNFGFNLTGINIGAEVEIDDIAQFASSGATTSPNMTGLIDENASGSFTRGLNFSATYTPDSGATGRGNILAPTLATVNGGLGLEYYVVDGTTTLFIEGANGDNQQIALGSFVQQTAPSAGAIKHPVVALQHPANHAHGAAKKPPHKWTTQTK